MFGIKGYYGALDPLIAALNALPRPLGCLAHVAWVELLPSARVVVGWVGPRCPTFEETVQAQMVGQWPHLGVTVVVEHSYKPPFKV